MADETPDVEPTEAADREQEGQQGPEPDWKAEARKWERRAKDNRKDLERVNKVLEGFENKAKEDQEREKTAAEALEAAKLVLRRGSGAVRAASSRR